MTFVWLSPPRVGDLEERGGLRCVFASWPPVSRSRPCSYWRRSPRRAPARNRSARSSGGIDFPAVPLVDAADVIVVFTPHIDIVTIAPVDRVVPGDLERVEKGAAPA